MKSSNRSDDRPDAENREWECVAISDLKEVGK